MKLLSENFKLPISRKRPASDIEICVPSTPATPNEQPTSCSIDHTTPTKTIIISLSLFLAITSTLGDRIPTNHATVRILQEDFDHDLIELSCNVHPLDGLAKNSGSTNSELDKAIDAKGACYGSDGTAGNLIRVSYNSQSRF